METYVKNVSQKASIDPNTIAAIIAMIMQMIEQCKNKPTPVNIKAGGGVWGRISLARAMRENGIRPLSQEGRKLADAMLSEANSADEESVKEFLAMCG